jgi:hypothetical protein
MAAFYVRTNPGKFFVVGKVLGILWPKFPGDNLHGMSVILDAGFKGKKSITNFRWFIVVKEGGELCTCV